MTGSQIRRLAAAAALAAVMMANAAHADNVLRRDNHDEPETLDPQKSDGLEEFWVQSDMFIGLARIDAHGRVAPDLATSWDISADGLTWTFHLRPHLKWSDGSPLTSEDIVWSFRRAVDPRTAASYASLLYPIEGALPINAGKEKDLTRLGVTAPDPDTVVVRLTHPTAYLAGVMTTGIAFPVPRKAVEAYGDNWTRPGKIITNGAFKMADWVPLQEVVLVRNPNYYAAGTVKLDGVRWIVFPDDTTAMRSFRNGEIDISRVPIREFLFVAKEEPELLHTGTSLWTTYMIANTQHKPLDDVRLRQALSMAIDRSVIATRVVPHGQAPALALIPPGIQGYTPQPPDWASLSLPERQALARKLVAEAGYGPDNPVRLSVIYPAGEEPKLELQAMVPMWASVGIAVTAQAEENQVVESVTRNHDFELSLYGWIADYPDPWTFLSPFDSHAGGLNTPDYHNPAYDALLAQASAELDPGKRMRALEQAEAFLAHDQPIIPISFDETPRLVSARVKGYYDNPLDQHRSGDMWLEPETRPGG